MIAQDIYLQRIFFDGGRNNAYKSIESDPVDFTIDFIDFLYWIPMLLWLLMQDYSGASDDKFVAWLFVLILFNSMSLLMDTLDVFRYWRGERKAL